MIQPILVSLNVTIFLKQIISPYFFFFNPVLFPMYLVYVLIPEVLQFERTIIYFILFFKWLRVFDLGFFFSS